MIEVVGMVYRSPAFLKFLCDQLGFYKNFRVVANDPSGDLKLWTTFEDIYLDPKPNDYYLNRVYRCWNYCVESSKAEYVCLVHTDMAFSANWLKNLERRLDGKTLPCSRMVEPGYQRPDGRILVPGEHALEIDLGRDPVRFPKDVWESVAADLSEDRVEPGGLYGCPVIHRDTFLSVGGFPEGNITKDGRITTGEDDSYVEALKGNLTSGDAYLFKKMEDAGFKHVTCFDSLVYHMQEGEMSRDE